MIERLIVFPGTAEINSDEFLTTKTNGSVLMTEVLLGGG